MRCVYDWIWRCWYSLQQRCLGVVAFIQKVNKQLLTVNCDKQEDIILHLFIWLRNKLGEGTVAEQHSYVSYSYKLHHHHQSNCLVRLNSCKRSNLSKNNNNNTNNSACIERREMVYLKRGYLVGRCQEKMKIQGQAPLYRSARNNKRAVRWKRCAGCLRYEGRKPGS